MHDATFDDERFFSVGLEAGTDALTEVARFTAPIDAQLLAGCLEAAGIPVFMGNLDTAHALGYMGAAVPIIVRVPLRLADAARAVIKAYEAGEYALDDDIDPEAPPGDRP